MVKLFGGSAFNGVPAGVIQRNDQSPGQYLPTPAALCELAKKRQARAPLTGLRSNKHLSNCSRTLVIASPALYRHGLLS
jgi:hypothetical protein